MVKVSLSSGMLVFDGGMKNFKRKFNKLNFFRINFFVNIMNKV